MNGSKVYYILWEMRDGKKRKNPFKSILCPFFSNGYSNGLDRINNCQDENL